MGPQSLHQFSDFSILNLVLNLNLNLNLVLNLNFVLTLPPPPAGCRSRC
jgi:hypothetical protein